MGKGVLAGSLRKPSGGGRDRDLPRLEHKAQMGSGGESPRIESKPVGNVDSGVNRLSARRQREGLADARLKPPVLAETRPSEGTRGEEQVARPRASARPRAPEDRPAHPCDMERQARRRRGGVSSNELAAEPPACGLHTANELADPARGSPARNLEREQRKAWLRRQGREIGSRAVDCLPSNGEGISAPHLEMLPF